MKKNRTKIVTNLAKRIGTLGLSLTMVLSGMQFGTTTVMAEEIDYSSYQYVLDCTGINLYPGNHYGIIQGNWISRV